MPHSGLNLKPGHTYHTLITDPDDGLQNVKHFF